MIKKVVLMTPHTSSHRTAEETLALGYLGSILRNGGIKHIVIDGWFEGLNSHQILERAMREERPSLLCFSCYRSNLDEARELLHLFHGEVGYISSVCGGYGATFHDEDFLDAGFTVVVRGEVEHMFLDLVQALDQELPLDSIPGLTFRKDNRIIRTERAQPVQDLDEIPFPVRGSVKRAIELRNPIHVCTSRGCMAHCVFCSVIAFAKGSTGSLWRYRSIENIVDELKMIVDTYNVRDFKFVDDSFLEPPRNEQWAEAFAEALCKRNLSIRFRTQVRADRLTANIVNALKEAGWFATSVGIENGSAGALRRMGKSATVEDNNRALALLKENEIYVQMGMILFDHATSMDELEENYVFLRSHDWVVTKGIFTEMFAALGTPFTHWLTNKKLAKAGKGNQNVAYDIRDPAVYRVYTLVKAWHRTHAPLYDWVIDSIGAPKILPMEGYQRVHDLCMTLLKLDLGFFRKALDHVQSEKHGDAELLEESVTSSAHQYSFIESRIAGIYRDYGLVYDGVLNPFL